MRLRNSVVAEVLLIAFVYGRRRAGHLAESRGHRRADVVWNDSDGGKLQPTLAGWWFGCVSLPVFQFILLRWYFRLFIWARFLWQVSRIDLRLVPTHPDRAGGLGFLSSITYAFAPLLAGQGVLLAGVIANKIFYAGAKLTDFKLELIAMVDDDALLRAGAAAGLHPAPGSHQAHGSGGIRRARPALRARV